MTNQYDPKSESSEIMSPEKRDWWASLWDKKGLKQPRIAVLQFAMNSTPRPTCPEETVAYGYMVGSKFHDKEPELLLSVIEDLDPDFFVTFPRRSLTKLNYAFKKAAIGEAARSFYRHGLAAYGKPGLRKHPDCGASSLAVL